MIVAAWACRAADDEFAKLVGRRAQRHVARHTAHSIEGKVLAERTGLEGIQGGLRAFLQVPDSRLGGRVGRGGARFLFFAVTSQCDATMVGAVGADSTRGSFLGHRCYAD